MTKDKDEKAVIRARMVRTGESYAAARAQLARGGDDVTHADVPAAAAANRGSLTTTAAAGRAVGQAAGGKSAWHLVLALRSVGGVSGRVLGWLGFPADVKASPVDPDGRAVASLQAALWAAAELKGPESPVDTGMLLRGAVDVLDPSEVPEEHAELATRLRGADLVGLCDAARRDLGPEDDDRIKPGQAGIFGRFTDRARAVIVLAQEEARTFDHDYIGTEHLLLGLLKEGGDVAFHVLAGRGVELAAMRDRVLQVIGRGEESPGGHIPFTPRSKKLLELALTTALDLGHPHVGTEHLLLALVDEGEGVAAQLLREVGCTADVVRTDVLAMLPER